MFCFCGFYHFYIHIPNIQYYTPYIIFWLTIEWSHVFISYNVITPLILVTYHSKLNTPPYHPKQPAPSNFTPVPSHKLQTSATVTLSVVSECAPYQGCIPTKSFGILQDLMQVLCFSVSTACLRSTCQS